MANLEEQMRRGLAEREVVRLTDQKAVLFAASQRLLLRICELQSRGQRRIDLAVTGGTDGIAMLREIGLSPLTSSVNWSGVHFWWGDERFVPATDPDRNALQARHALLNTLMSQYGLPEKNIHEMPAETRTLQQIADASQSENEQAVQKAADRYQAEIVQEMGEDPRFDVAWFGVGPDAHFASLMPGLPQISLDDPHQLVCGVTGSPNQPPLRVSLTVPMIQRSTQTWVIASGERKKQAMEKVLGKPGTSVRDGVFDDPAVPVSFAAGRELTLWIVDRVCAPTA